MSLWNGVRKEFFQRLWNDYENKVPDAALVEDSLREQGEVWIEDHVAFRALPGEHTGAHVLQEIFSILGYSRRDSYHFDEKCLNAFWMEPPVEARNGTSETIPKIFISELEIAKFSPSFQKIVNCYVADVVQSPLAQLKSLSEKVKADDKQAAHEMGALLSSYFLKGASWKRPSYSDYETLLRESEYGAWTLLFGSAVNHFTVSVHLMKSYTNLEQFNEFLMKKLGVSLNKAGGGFIKGTPTLRLEQSASLANEIHFLFQEGVRKIPYAYVEFAFRHPLEGCKADRQWDSYYQGFVSNNADKIFESTNVRKT
jgi:hypothetical protein